MRHTLLAVWHNVEIFWIIPADSVGLYLVLSVWSDEYERPKLFSPYTVNEMLFLRFVLALQPWKYTVDSYFSDPGVWRLGQCPVFIVCSCGEGDGLFCLVVTFVPCSGRDVVSVIDSHMECIQPVWALQSCRADAY